MNTDYINWCISYLSSVEIFFSELSSSERTNEFILQELGLLQNELDKDCKWKGAKLQYKKFHKCKKCRNVSSYLIFITHPSYLHVKMPLSTYVISIEDHCENNENSYEIQYGEN